MKERLNNWWFSPVDALPLGVVRIGFALLFLSYIITIAPYRYAFFSEQGVLSTVLATGGPAGPNLLRFANAAQVDFVLGLSVFAGGFMLIGLWTRPSAWLVWICLMSFQGRNPLAHTGADVVLRLLAFYLAVSPSGAALSCDCLNTHKAWSSIISAWPIRLLQLQAAVIYGDTFLMKTQGDKWRDGTAMHYILGLTDYQRFPWPHALDTPLIMCLLSWGVLALELSLAVLIWVPRWRRLLLASAVALHLGIDWVLTISQFSGAMLVLLCAFVTPSEFRRVALAARSAWRDRRTLPHSLCRNVRTWPPALRAYETVQFALYGEPKDA